MTISGNQRNFIAKNHRRLTPEEMARQLRVREREVMKVIWDIETGTTSVKRESKLAAALDLLIEYGIYFLTAAAPLFFIKYTHQFATLSKTVFTETVAGMLFTLWAVKVLLEQRLTFTKSPIVFLAALFVAWSALSAVWAVNPFETVHYGIYLFSCLLLAFLVQETFISSDQVKRFVAACLSGGTLVAVIGIIQHLTGFDGIPQDARPASTLGNKNFASHFMLLMLPLALSLWRLSKTRWGKSASVFGGAVMFLYLLLTTARAAWLGLCGGGLIVAAMFLLLKGISPIRAVIIERKRLAAALLGVACLVFCFVAFVKIPVVEKFRTEVDLVNTVKSIRDMDDPGIQSRLNIWRNSWKMIKDHPVGGVGAENFKIMYPLYSHAVAPTAMSLVSTVEHAHNDYLQIAAELGFVGLFFYGALMLTCLYMLVVVVKHVEDKTPLWVANGLIMGLIALLIDSAFDFPNKLPIPILFAFLFFGITAVLHRIAAGGVPRMVVPRGGPGLWATRALPFVSFLFLMLTTFWGLRFLLADHHLLMSKAYYDNRRNDLSYQEAKKMIDLYPFSYKYWLSWGSANSMIGNYDEAIRINDHALKYDPYRFQILYNQGANYLKQDNPKKATEYFAKLVAMNPDFGEAHMALAIAYSNMGDKEKAILHAKEAIRIEPGYGYDEAIREILKESQ